MMLPHRRSTIRLLVASITLFILFVTLGCGPQDYEKPIQGFQDASKRVITAERGFLANENTIEQDIYINQMVFEQKRFGPKDIDAQTIITPEEIKLRTGALDALSKYTVSLATLASGKAESSVGDDCKDASDKLKDLANDAGSRSATDKSADKFDSKFSGIAGAAATAIGAVAKLILDHKASTAIKASVNSTDKDVTALIELIGTDAQLSYERQRTRLSDYSMQLFNDYNCEVGTEPPSGSNGGAAGGVQCRKTQGDTASLLALADRIKALRADQATLAEANPAPAIMKMKKAHEDLVKYVNAPSTPQNLEQLKDSVRSFIAAAQPLGDAVQQLLSNGK